MQSLVFLTYFFQKLSKKKLWEGGRLDAPWYIFGSKIHAFLNKKLRSGPSTEVLKVS